MGFIEKSVNSLMSVDSDQLYSSYDFIYPGEGTSAIYIGAQKGGKSLNAASIGFRNLSDMGHKILINDPDNKYPLGRNLVSILAKMGEMYDKCTYFAVSGSGTSTGPMRHLEDIKNPDRESLPNLNICAITYSPGSPIAELARKLNGSILEIKGRDPSSKMLQGHEYISETSLLEELFERNVTRTTGIMASGILNYVEPDSFPDYFRSEVMKQYETKEFINSVYETDFYKSLLERIEDPFTKFFMCGQGVSDVLVKKCNIRMGHVRSLLSQKLDAKSIIDAFESGKEPGNDKNYVIGESNASPMDRNSVLVCVSESGSGDIKDCIKSASKSGTDTYLITKNPRAWYDGVKTLVIDSEYFYPDVVDVFIDLYVHACHDFVDQGMLVNEDTVGEKHQKDKIGGKGFGRN